ncbi:MAG: cation transporter [Planctomycetes bacterium]|nr:cation transporter [Planctomycetota bacterium]
MKLITRWLVRRLVVNYRDIDNVKVRGRYGSLEAWASIGVNVLLFGVKLVLGLMVNSVALIADAVHTLSDTGTSIVILIGFKIAKRPADREHPFGHGRMESIATLIVAVLLIVAGFELLRSGGVRILEPTVAGAEISWVVALILIGTMVAKELMARFAVEMSKMVKSKTLEADAWHHRSDAFSTLLVLIAMFCAYQGYHYVDGLAGVGVALIVIYSGYAIARDAISPLLGERPGQELLDEIAETAGGVAGVEGVHDIIVHRYGQVKLMSLHIEVSPSDSVQKLHDISEQVAAGLEEKLGGTAVVHIDPMSTGHKEYDRIYQAVRQLIRDDKRIVGFHDLQISEIEGEMKVSFDVIVDHLADEEEGESLKDRLTVSLEEELGGWQVLIRVEGEFV